MGDNLQIHQYVVHCERKVKQKCQICASSFKFGNAEHICKRCYRSVCSDCSPFKVKCYTSDYKNLLHRMCRKCNIESQYLQKYVKQNRLKWGQDSDIVKLWLRQLGLKTAPKKRSSEKKKAKQYVSFNQVWKSLNFSFRQFIGIVIDEAKINQNDFAQMINLALSQLSTNKLMDLQHVVYILMFFLAHSSFSNALYFTTAVVQICSTEELQMENFHFYLEQMHCTQMQAYKMQNIIEQTFEKIARRCTINVFTAEVSIQVIGQIFAKREFEQLEKAISFVFSERKEFICLNANKPQQIFLDILRNISSKNYRKVLKQIEGQNTSKSQLSQKSDSQSNRSSPSRVSNTIKRQNEQLKRKLSQQQQELEQLRKQVAQYRIQAQAKKNQKKNVQANIFTKTAGEMSLMKDRKSLRNDQSTSEQNDEANFSNVIHKKNQQIIQIKKQLENVKEALIKAKMESKGTDSERQSGAQQRKIIKQKQEQIQKLKQQTESLKNTNKRLFIKLNELTNLIMDKQEKNINDANKFFDELPADPNSPLSKQKLNDCKMY